MSNKLPALTPKQIADTLWKGGYRWVSPGDHRNMELPGKEHKVSIPNPHGQTISPNSELFKNILRQAKMSKPEFTKLYFSKKKRRRK